MNVDQTFWTDWIKSQIINFFFSSFFFCSVPTHSVETPDLRSPVSMVPVIRRWIPTGAWTQRVIIGPWRVRGVRAPAQQLQRLAAPRHRHYRGLTHKQVNRVWLHFNAAINVSVRGRCWLLAARWRVFSGLSWQESEQTSSSLGLRIVLFLF